jgi:hypothetical protein
MKSSPRLQRFTIIEWTTGGVIIVVMTLGWLLSRNLSLTTLDEFAIFPLLGLIAFGLMWSHYVLGSLRRRMNLAKPERDTYWGVSSGLVLALIVLHPLLLNYGLISDGLGLPPASYAEAYGSLAPYLTLGMICLLVFLSYEFKRWFGKKSWWRVVDYIQIAAMIGIFVHALMLGQELTQPWFLIVWWLLGVTLIMSWIYNWYEDNKMKEKSHE